MSGAQKCADMWQWHFHEKSGQFVIWKTFVTNQPANSITFQVQFLISCHFFFLRNCDANEQWACTSNEKLNWWWREKMFPRILFSKRSSNYVQSEPNKNEKKNRSNANYTVDVAKTHAHSFSTHLYVHSRDLIEFTIYKAVQKRRNNTAESNFFSSYFSI